MQLYNDSVETGYNENITHMQRRWREDMYTYSVVARRWGSSVPRSIREDIASSAYPIVKVRFTCTNQTSQVSFGKEGILPESLFIDGTQTVEFLNVRIPYLADHSTANINSSYITVGVLKTLGDERYNALMFGTDYRPKNFTYHLDTEGMVEPYAVTWSESNERVLRVDYGSEHTFLSVKSSEVIPYFVQHQPTLNVVWSIFSNLPTTKEMKLLYGYRRLQESILAHVGVTPAIATYNTVGFYAVGWKMGDNKKYNITLDDTNVIVEVIYNRRSIPTVVGRQLASDLIRTQPAMNVAWEQLLSDKTMFSQTRLELYQEVLRVGILRKQALQDGRIHIVEVQSAAAKQAVEEFYRSIGQDVICSIGTVLLPN